jgi:magnesium transporter
MPHPRRSHPDTISSAMIKLVYLTPGSSPASLEIEGRVETLPPTITLCTYSDSSLEETICKDADDAIRRLDPEKNNWIDIDGLADVETVRRLGEHFGLTPLTIEDILTSQRPKMEHLDDGIFLITTMAYHPRDEQGVVEIEQLSLFLGWTHVVTFQQKQKRESFGEIRRRLRMANSPIRKFGPDFLVYTLLDTVVDDYFPVLEMIGDETEIIEEGLVERPSSDVLKELFHYKRVLLEMRRGAWPQREVFSHLMHEEKGLISEHTRICLRDCYEHITQIIDIIENYRDLTSGLMDVYHSSLSYRTNEIMRVLTLFSTFFMPLTFLVGVYGMNFHDSPYNMPELSWRYGYPACWLVMISISITMFLYFRRKKWI